jgi:predicted house-cleaning noncanonical NTP pyrophosphatase (MazG superfamily)
MSLALEEEVKEYMQYKEQNQLMNVLLYMITTLTKIY